MTLPRTLGPLAHGCVAAVCSTIIATASLAAQAPSKSEASWLVGADWLQAGALTLERSTIPSNAISLERRTETLFTQFGYLRAVREMSTVQGGYTTFGRVLRSGALTATAGLGAFVGQVQASVDTSGYHYIANGVPGYQSRFTFASSVAVGAGVQLAVGVALGKSVELRASVAQWAFSGKPINGDNGRLLAGAGLAVHLPSKMFKGASR